MCKYILDANDQPVRCDDVIVWGKWFETAERIVKKTVSAADGWRVSTVFLGLDHSFTHGEPVLWETMIFGGPHDGFQDRYTSRQDAVAGHERAVELAQSVVAVDPHATK